VSGNDNGSNGVGVFLVLAVSPTLIGNKIGTDQMGNANFILQQHRGIETQLGSNHLIGSNLASDINVISGNLSFGIMLKSDNCIVKNNNIGLGFDGVTSVPNGSGVIISNDLDFINGTNNVIGGDPLTSSFLPNFISGNNQFGILIDNSWSGATNYIQGNIIGLNRLAAGAGNGSGKTGGGGGVGSSSSSGTVKVGPRNVISGNIGNGIILSGANVRGFEIINNYIGTDINGNNANVGNRQNGVRVENNSIDHVIRNNRIAYNGGFGISIAPTSQSNVQGLSTENNGNEIFNNGCASCAVLTGQGLFAIGNLINVDIGDNGPTVNNPNDGIQDYPVINSSTLSRNQITVNGSFITIADRYETQFFITTTPCLNGNIPQTISYFLGSKLDYYGPVSNFSYQFPLPAGVTSGYVQATAINRHLRKFQYKPTEARKRPAGKSSSEYSPCIQSN
jgi:hypothetical protein